MKLYRPVSNIPGSTPALRVFRQPDLDSRPMARMWFPDAGAGAVEDDCVEKQLCSMAQGGIGGVEVALLGDDTGNLDAEHYGWGTPNWVKTMRKVLRAARAIPGGFKVDFTITSHWPPIVNTIDPNDPEASSNLVFTYKKLRPGDKLIELPLPETKLYDSGQNPFIFKDTLAGAVIAKVAGAPLPELRPMGFGGPPDGTHHFGPEKTMFEGKIMPEGMGGGMPPMPKETHKVPFVLELDSLKSVTGRVTETAGYPCGVPDALALEAWYKGEVSETDVIAAFGPPADESRLLPDGKRDVDLNRKRMADIQYRYTLNAENLAKAASAGEELRPGDTVVIACYCRGTGQIFSGGFKSRLMKNMTYAANYFTVSGTRAITDYWDTYILSDPELRTLMEENAARVGGSIFEDSIELHSNGANWSVDFPADMARRMGCDPVQYMPVYLGLYFDDPDGANRILEEYRLAEGGMYQENHIEVLNRWCATFGYRYRAQAGMPGINIIGANTATGITEGDNGTFKDSNRKLAGAVNMVPEKKFLSFESNTFTGFPFPWSLLAQECHFDASTGTNRIIFHGTAYCKNVHDFYDWWPGWNWGGGGGKAYDFMAWDKRVCWWDDAHAMTDYLSRLCGILQNAQAKPDLAVMLGSGDALALGDSVYSFLTDRGYSYNILGDYTLTLPTATVTNGRLYEDGPGYRALVLKDMEALRMDTAERIFHLAKAGLPVIFDGPVPARVLGMEKTGADDEAFRALMTELTALENVYVLQGDQVLLGRLNALGIRPAAAYAAAGLEATHMQDSTVDYYAFYNDTSSAMTVPVGLACNGTLVRLNCWTGEAVPVGAEDNFTLELASQDMAFYALMPEIPAEEPVDAVPGETIRPERADVTLESFGPAEPGDPEYDPSCPIESHRETVSFNQVPLGFWSELPADRQTLERLRVGNMADVSGRCAYAVEFDLPEGVAAIEVSCTHGDQDFLVGGSINNLPIPAVNCMTDKLLLTNVHPGRNHLTLKLDSTLTNRLNFESPRLMEGRDLSLMSFGFSTREFSHRHSAGITALTVLPYNENK